MTLVSRPKPPAHHKKFSGRHHKQTKSYHKAYWPYLPIALIVVAGMLFNIHTGPKRGVLAYATDMSVSELLAGTNSQRTANGYSSLNLNSLLDQAAQNKANDMVARDYWSHTTPDGQTPWSFYDAVGYQYQAAGENLAYGFDTSSDTITGWMNSPEHRANILNGTYTEVGFGIANSPNFQGSGPETIVVAEYALPVVASTPAPVPVAAAPAPVAAHTAPVQSTAVSSSASGSSGGGEASQPASDASPANPAPQTTTNSTKATTTTQPVKPIVEPRPQTVSTLQELTAGKAPWSVTVMTVLLASGMLIFFARHGIAWHKVIRKGEKFFLKHPALDIAATLIIVIGLLLTRSVGSIR